MKRAARVFANLLLVAVLALAAVVIWERDYAPPDVPPALAPLDGRIDRILIEKDARRLTVFRGGEALRSYRIALGFAAEGDKQRQGDGRTPEGVFRVDRRNPESAYHLSLGIDYPQADDIARAQAGGYSPGGDIFIHGQPNGVGSVVTLPYDWTAGCIAVSDDEIEELWRVTPVGTEVEIRP
jgi:murein L,D-transpeptidase YafK